MPMLGDDVQSVAAQITIKAVDLTYEIILKAFRAMRESKKVKEPRFKKGKQTLKQLNKQNIETTLLEVNNRDIKFVQKQLKKFGVDFSVLKGVEPYTYNLVCKGKDIDQIDLAIKRAIAYGDHKREIKEEQRAKKAKSIPIKERIAAAVVKAKELNEKIKQHVLEPLSRKKPLNRGAR